MKLLGRKTAYVQMCKSARTHECMRCMLCFRCRRRRRRAVSISPYYYYYYYALAPRSSYSFKARKNVDYLADEAATDKNANEKIAIAFHFFFLVFCRSGSRSIQNFQLRVSYYRCAM